MSEADGEILELSLDTFLTVYREPDQFPLELAEQLSLEQCQQLIPEGPGGWRKVSAILSVLLREARENRNQAGKARTDAFKIRQSADEKIEGIRNEAKTLIARGELSVEEAKRTSSKMISEIQAEAERKCKVLRERHNEHEILLGKLMASNDNLARKIQETDKVTEEHDDMIKNIIKYTGEKFEDFEQNAHRLAKTNISLDNKIENKLRTLEETVGSISLSTDSQQAEILKFKTEIRKNVMIFTMLPFIGLFFLYFWLSFTLPTRITTETKPAFADLNMNIDYLRKGIESKVANLELDTFSELKLSKKALSSLDKNLEQRFEIFIKKFQKELQTLEFQLEKFEKSYKSDVVGLKEDLEDKLSEIQVETMDRISEASTRIDEFMVPKLWLSKVNPKEKGNVVESSSLGLYREEGKENMKPLFKQVGGEWILHFTNQQKWVLSSPTSDEEEEEIFFQQNPKLSELTTDRWRYPSHKVSLVHTVPCCKTLVARDNLGAGAMLTLTDKVEGGRGVWEAAQGDLVMFDPQSSSWKMKSERWSDWARSQASSLCPPATFHAGQESLELSCH